MLKDYLPVLMQIVIASGFAVVTLLASVLLGKSGTANDTKDSAYECGMLPIGDAQPRFSVKFYMVAVLFLLFDLEAVFLFPWSSVYQKFVQSGAALFALGEMALFLGTLFLGWFYCLRRGAFEWD